MEKQTIKLYQQDVYLKETEARVVKSDDCLVLLDQTLFFPTGGGQSCDLGTINDYQVLDVYEDGDLVWHKVDRPGLKEGDVVSLSLDWPRRFDNMQRHCGEHILSGIFHKLYGGVNRGFHMGDDYMTIDISLEDDPKFTKLDFDMCLKAQELTNEVIWNNLPVITRRFEKKEDAMNLPLRKALAIDEEITIVCVGDINNPSDCVACCGTHPSTAGQVGLVKIFKVENNKGMFRIYFEAGKRALMDYNKKHDLLTTLGNRFSAGTDDLLKKISANEEKHKETKTQLNTLRQSVINSRIEEIKGDLEILNEDNDLNKILVYSFDDMNVDSLLNIGRPLCDDIKKLLIIVSEPDNTCLLFSNGDVDCGKLVKENAPIYQGKGGGSKTNARAMFTSKSNVETFIDLLDKHLR